MSGTNKWAQLWKDAVLQRVDDVAEKIARVQPAGQSFLERYREAALEFHLHATFHKLVWQVGDFDASVRIERAWDRSEVDGLLCALAPQGEAGFHGPGDREVNDSVLVSVRERIEESQQYTVMGSRAWLQTVDNCVRVYGHTAKGIDLPVIPVLGVVEDGERTVRILGEGGPQVIERGAGVMHYVADRDAQFRGWLDEQLELNPHCVLLSINLGRVSCGLRLEVGEDLCLKGFEMSFSPDDFGVNAA